MVTPVLHHDIPWRITHPSFCLILTVTFCSFKKLKTTYIIHPLLHQHLLRTYYMQGTWLDATGMGMYKTSLVAQTAKHLPTMQETWVQSLGQEDPLEKETATHSSILAWKIPWIEERGRLQSTGSQRVGHDWATSLHFTLRQRPWPRGGCILVGVDGYTKVKMLLAHSCLTLCVPMDCSLPGFSVHGILQARIVEWVVIPFSRGSSWPRDQTWVSLTAGRFFTMWVTI